MTMVVFAVFFEWQFILVEATAVAMYFIGTYFMTERRAPAFIAMTLAD